uniref:Uncharacterized protein n=1 Tax=Buteo japonicus TaxID=224669 RepID=A0A8B9Z9U0_9AVES
AMLGGQVLLLLGQDLGGRVTSVIAMSNRGDWAWPEMCPKGFYTSGVSFKVQPLCRCPQLVGGPCSHGDSGQDLGGRVTSVIAMSNRGDWAWPEMCPKGFYTSGVSFKVQPLCRCPHDEVATTSALFACSDGHVLEGPGSAWGQWGGWSPWCPSAVCGIQTSRILHGA